MPRKEIDLPYRVEYLSILDQDGQADRSLEPSLPDEVLLRIYRTMVLARRFDERMLNLQRQGRIGTFPPIKGQEAQIGATAALEPGDWLVPSFRETPAEIWRGRSMESVLLVYGGYNEGGYVPEGLNNLPVAIPVGSQTLHAVGLGYAIKYRKERHVAMVFFGDGATSEGDFHEAMNFSSVFQIPVVFIAQNNHWAISVPRSRQTHSRTLAQKALAFDMPGLQVDGNDVLAMYVAAKEAVDRARNGDGPSFIESVTYRVSMHTTADDPKRYRREEEVEEWIKRDPIVRFQKYLTDKRLLTDQKAAAFDDDVLKEIKAAEERWQRMVEKVIDPLDMFEHTFAVMPPDLLTQREDLLQELVANRKDAGHSA
jgi:pyruvate dehydrogenase E1 component alpha subunit